MPYLTQEYNRPKATMHLIIINVIVYLAVMINNEFMVGTFALWPPVTSPWFRPWQPLSYLFLHGSFWHIFFNMYSLYLFGSAVERKIGTGRFLLLYFACGLGAAGLHVAVQILTGSWVPTVGASGAVYGLIVAFAMLFPQARMMLLFPPIPMSAKWMAVVFIGLELFTGITGTQDGVAHFAHLGGALIGFILIWLWYKRRSRPNPFNQNNFYDTGRY